MKIMTDDGRRAFKNSLQEVFDGNLSNFRQWCSQAEDAFDENDNFEIHPRLTAGQTIIVTLEPEWFCDDESEEIFGYDR